MTIANLNALRVEFSKLMPEGFAGWVTLSNDFRQTVDFTCVTVFDGEELTARRAEALFSAMWEWSKVPSLAPTPGQLKFGEGVLQYIARDLVRQLTHKIEMRPRYTRPN